MVGRIAVGLQCQVGFGTIALQLKVKTDNFDDIEQKPLDVPEGFLVPEWHSHFAIGMDDEGFYGGVVININENLSSSLEASAYKGNRECFVAGLKPELRAAVRAQEPTDLFTAIKQAKYQETVVKKQGKVALIPYIKAGDPDLLTTAEALKVLDFCGSDILELGVPYNDPLADGPVIQVAPQLSSDNRLRAPLFKEKHKANASLIAETFSNLKKQGKVPFIPYITAGDPDLLSTAEALKVLDSCGSDIIELGVPYSYPLADEPVIQAAASRSLAKETNFDAIISMLKEDGQVGYWDVLEYEMVKQQNNASNKVVDIGDYHLMRREWSFECPLPQVVLERLVRFCTIARPLKTQNVYFGGPVPMEIDTNDQEQRDCLFYGRCYIKGKPCLVVMDTGCLANIIAQSLCNYLQLGLMYHPKPYFLTGIGDTGIPVSRQASVAFTVGDYVDTKFFDVVPTTAVDVLLGLRWMSEMKAIYYAEANVWLIQKDRRIIPLYPLTLSEIDELNDIKKSRAYYES